MAFHGAREIRAKIIEDQGKLLRDRIDSLEVKFDSRMDQMFTEMMEMKGDIGKLQGLQATNVAIENR